MAPAPSFDGSSRVHAEAWAALGRSDLEPSTCWDFPDQGSRGLRLGDPAFNGVTPVGCVVNLVRRYTRPGDLVLDPMSGSGTVLDVTTSLGRRVAAFDLVPRRRDIARADARLCPVRSGVAALVIVDSPYSDNVVYGGGDGCLGRIPCREPRFYEEMDRVAVEAHRVLRPNGVLAWVISDEYRRSTYTPTGFRMFDVLARRFRPIDTVVLVRHHDRSASPMWEHRARRFNFFLRGFKFLFIMRKEKEWNRNGETTGTRG